MCAVVVRDQNPNSLAFSWFERTCALPSRVEGAACAGGFANGEEFVMPPPPARPGGGCAKFDSACAIAPAWSPKSLSRDFAARRGAALGAAAAMAMLVAD